MSVAEKPTEIEADAWQESDAERVLAMLRRAVGVGEKTDRRTAIRRNRYYCRTGTRDARLWGRLEKHGFAYRYDTIVPEIALWCVTPDGARLLDLSEQQIERIARLLPSCDSTRCG